MLRKSIQPLLFITLTIIVIGYLQIVDLLIEVLKSGYSSSNENSKTVPASSLLTPNIHSASSSFNTFNPYTKSWCPSAKCYNSPLCAPCKRRFLFILATGRSGSTSLLRMFNELPNVRLSGENYNILFRASELFKVILEDYPEHFVDEETMKEGYFMHNAVENGPFMHNAIPLGSFSCVMQNFLTALNPPDLTSLMNLDDSDDEDSPLSTDKGIAEEERTILGIKEIRLQNEDLLEWTPEEATKFLNAYFPCSRFIINISYRYVRQSKTMKKHLIGKTDGLKRTEVKEVIKRENDFLTELSSLLGSDSAKLLNVNEWSEDVSIINDVVDWLGFENCKFNSIVHENNGALGGGFRHDNTTILDVGPNCAYPYS